MVALEFLFFCFGGTSEALIEGIPIPQHVLAKARELTEAGVSASTLTAGLYISGMAGHSGGH